MLGHAGPRFGLKSSAVAKTFRNPGLDRRMVGWRQVTGLRIIPAKGAVKALLRAVRVGNHVGVLMDQNTHPRRGGIFVDFFGLPATFTRTPAMLARRMDLEVRINTFVREDGAFRFRTLPLPRPAADYADDASLTQDMVRGIEALIRRYPEQYVWLYKRWRYIPAACSAELAARFPYYAHTIRDR
jgi:lauroyl/myristoyl acyltransferase